MYTRTMLVLTTLIVACITFAVPLTVYTDIVAPRRLPAGQLEASNIVNTWSAYVPLGIIYVFFLIWMIRGWQLVIRERRKKL